MKVHIAEFVYRMQMKGYRGYFTLSTGDTPLARRCSLQQCLERIAEQEHLQQTELLLVTALQAPGPARNIACGFKMRYNPEDGFEIYEAAFRPSSLEQPRTFRVRFFGELPGAAQVQMMWPKKRPRPGRPMKGP